MPPAMAAQGTQAADAVGDKVFKGAMWLLGCHAWWLLGMCSSPPAGMRALQGEKHCHYKCSDRLNHAIDVPANLPECSFAVCAHT